MAKVFPIWFRNSKYAACLVIAIWFGPVDKATLSIALRAQPANTTFGLWRLRALHLPLWFLLPMNRVKLPESPESYGPQENAKWSSSRPGCRKMTHKPFIPACPALPHRCRNTLGSVGGSTCTTKFTWGISRPCAATYLMRRREGMVKLVKAAKFFLRTLGGCLPCWGTGPNGRPSWWGSTAGRTCWKYSTAAQVDR